MRPATGVAGQVGQEGVQILENAEDAADFEMTEAQGGSSKRVLEADEDYITPNKTARSRPWSEESSSNPYSALLTPLADNIEDPGDDDNLQL